MCIRSAPELMHAFFCVIMSCTAMALPSSPYAVSVYNPVAVQHLKGVGHVKTLYLIFHIPRAKLFQDALLAIAA